MTNEADKTVFQAIGQVWSSSGEPVIQMDDARKLFKHSVSETDERDSLQLFTEQGMIESNINDPSWVHLLISGARTWMNQHARGKLESICRAAIHPSRIGKTLRELAAELKVPEVWVDVAFHELQLYRCIVALSMPFYESTVLEASSTARRAFSQ